jgi:hypothetical protein
MKASYAITIALLAVALGNPSAARAQTHIVSFGGGPSATNDYTYTDTATTSTLSANIASGSIQLDSAFATGSPTGSLTGIGISVSLTSTTAASGGTQGGFGGTVTLTNNTGSPLDGVAPGGNIMTIAVSGATLSDSGGGGSAVVSGGVVTITPGPTLQHNPIVPPMSFGLSLSGVTAAPGTPTPHLGFGNFTASDTGTASATITTRPVPEPSTLALAGLGAMGLIGYGLRRRKARTA